MKKLLLAVLLCTAAPAMVLVSSQATYARSGSNDGTSIPASTVPKPVRQTFRQMYSTASQTKWFYNPPVYYGTASYSAEFYLGIEKWEATFDPSGTFLFAVRKV